jgi:hypothetical protein
MDCPRDGEKEYYHCPLPMWSSLDSEAHTALVLKNALAVV